MVYEMQRRRMFSFSFLHSVAALDPLDMIDAIAVTKERANFRGLIKCLYARIAGRDANSTSGIVLVRIISARIGGSARNPLKKITDEGC